MERSGFKFSIDRGGTFTDVVAINHRNEFKTIKLLSEDPANYHDAPTEGINLNYFLISTHSLFFSQELEEFYYKHLVIRR